MGIRARRLEDPAFAEKLIVLFEASHGTGHAFKPCDGRLANRVIPKDIKNGIIEREIRLEGNMA